MKQYKLLLVFILSLIFCLGCNRTVQIKKMLESEDKTDIIEGCSKINSLGDTAFIDLILKNPYDVRISHNYRFKGVTVHKAKMKAMERISGVKPPHLILFSADTINVEFYKKWAREKGYIK